MSGVTTCGITCERTPESNPSSVEHPAVESTFGISFEFGEFFSLFMFCVRQQSSLTNHMKTHSVAKPYKCPVLWCDKSFKVNIFSRLGYSPNHHLILLSFIGKLFYSEIERILTTIDYAHGLNELPQWKGSYRRHYQTAHNGQSTTQNLILLSS